MFFVAYAEILVTTGTKYTHDNEWFAMLQFPTYKPTIIIVYIIEYTCLNLIATQIYSISDILY